MCLDFPLQDWFDHEVPETSIAPDYIEQCLNEGLSKTIKQNAVVVWLGHAPEMTLFEVKKGGKTMEMAELEFFDKKKDWQLQTTAIIGNWILKTLPPKPSEGGFNSPMLCSYKELVISFESVTGLTFEDFTRSREWFELRENGLLIL
jgi:hypothetical protein